MSIYGPGRRPRWWQGFFDMGPARIPPMPVAIQMTDRTTGTVYFLTHTGTSPGLVFSLSTVLYSLPDVRTFGPFAGPYLGGTVRLFVNNGALGGEFVTNDGPASGHWNQRVVTRRNFDTTNLEITLPTNWQPGQSFTYTEVKK